MDDIVADEGNTVIYIDGSRGNPYYRDLFNVQNHTTGTGNINGITVFVRVWKIYYATSAYISIKTGGTVYESPVFSIPSGSPTYPFATYFYRWPINPKTGSAWTWDDIDALQIGIRQCAWWLSSNNWGTAKTTQVYVAVDYGNTSKMGGGAWIPGVYSNNGDGGDLPFVSDNTTSEISPFSDNRTGGKLPWSDNTTDEELNFQYKITR